jgi:PAS domain S-box-containing protein
MRLYFEKHILIGFSLAIVVLIFLSWYSFSSLQRLIHTASLLSRASRVINAAEQVMKSVVDLETGQRGYVITGDSVFLEPFKEARQQLPNHLHVLDSLTIPNLKQNSRLIQLRQLIDQQLEWVNNVVVARKTNFEQASELIKQGTGLRITNEIRTHIKGIQSDERLSFTSNNTVTASTLRQFQISFFGLALTAISIVVYLSYTINVTLRSRKRIEHKLHQSVRETHDLYDKAPCGYFSVSKQITITSINHTLLIWLGYQQSEVVNKMSFFELFSDKSSGELSEKLGMNFENYRSVGNINDLELECKRKDGSVFPIILNSLLLFDKRGELAGYNCTVFDNTERKRVQDKFRGLLEAAPDASVIVDKHGVIQMANNHCNIIFGYTREELIGQKVELLMPVRYQNSHVGHRHDFFSQPSIRPMGMGLELWGVRKNGEEFPIEISLSPIETSEGLLVSTSIRDVTERKKIEDVILKLNKELESFTYSVSHDLRAPLRSVLGYAQILKEDYADKLDDEGNRFVGIIMKNAKRMGSLIDDLLNFSRLGRKEIVKGKVNMNELVRDIVQDLRTTGGSEAIEFNISSLNSAEADVSMLRQVWINLLSNAIKYSSKKEIIKIDVGSYNTSTEHCYFVKDNGAGFDMQYAGKLFGVFQRLHKMDEFEGTGVGLALVKTIIDRHGGRVWAEGELDTGATFYFSLPK